MGQSKQVVIYRLNSCGTVEEKIYRKQIFKAYLMKTATSKNSHQTVRYLFKLKERKKERKKQTTKQRNKETKKERNKKEKTMKEKNNER